VTNLKSSEVLKEAAVAEWRYCSGIWPGGLRRNKKNFSMTDVPADIRKRNFTSTSLDLRQYTKLLEGSVLSINEQLISSGVFLVGEH